MSGSSGSEVFAVGDVGTLLHYDIDADDDLIQDSEDNCPFIANPHQGDVDLDTVGDVCDNCPIDANLDQADADLDTVGDVGETASMSLIPAKRIYYLLGATKSVMPVNVKGILIVMEIQTAQMLRTSN